MDEKLGIRFRKMQKCKIIHILHFCLRKEVKNLFNIHLEHEFIFSMKISSCQNAHFLQFW